MNDTASWQLHSTYGRLLHPQRISPTIQSLQLIKSTVAESAVTLYILLIRSYTIHPVNSSNNNTWYSYSCSNIIKSSQDPIVPFLPLNFKANLAREHYNFIMFAVEHINFVSLSKNTTEIYIFAMRHWKYLNNIFDWFDERNNLKWPQWPYSDEDRGKVVRRHSGVRRAKLTRATR